MGASFTIQQILRDHWDAYLLEHPDSRPIVKQEVHKVLGCGDISRGYAFFYCPNCVRYRYVPFRCHSRFCNTCGTAYQQDRAIQIQSKLIQCPHRHVVFTMAQELRPFFLADRKLLHLLFEAASSVILSMFLERNSKAHFVPGVVAVLHTFGRDLKWNPHIHMLLTEGAAGHFTVFRPFRHFPYVKLRKAWQAALLLAMEQALGKASFRPLKNRLFQLYPDGFYVHAPYRDLTSATSVISYMTRYLGRPAMAQSRIFDYDGQSVSFWYERHEDGKRQDVTLPAFAFIHLLLQHIPQKHFHMLRYYGLYASHHPQQTKLFRMVKPQIAAARKRIWALWPFRASLFFGRDPLLCSCGSHMELDYLVFPPSTIVMPP